MCIQKHTHSGFTIIEFVEHFEEYQNTKMRLKTIKGQVKKNNKEEELSTKKTYSN